MTLEADLYAQLVPGNGQRPVVKREARRRKRVTRAPRGDVTARILALRERGIPPRTIAARLKVPIAKVYQTPRPQPAKEPPPSRAERAEHPGPAVAPAQKKGPWI